MAKFIFQIAQELGLPEKMVFRTARELGLFGVRDARSEVSGSELEALLGALSGRCRVEAVEHNTATEDNPDHGGGQPNQQEGLPPGPSDTPGEPTDTNQGTSTGCASDATLRDVVQRLDANRLIELGRILRLHNPSDAEDFTWAQMIVGDNDTPFSLLDREGQEKAICKAISRAGGHSLRNLFRGGGVSYGDAVRSVAKHLKLKVSPIASAPEVEAMVAQRVFGIILEQLTSEQRLELAENLERLAASHGRSFAGQGGVLAALTAAQLSGFGIYLAASIAVKALMGFLGITLSFGFYATMSSVISVVIGPAGWATLGFAATYKLGSPNMKKLLPAVLLIAAERNAEVR